MGEFSTLRKRGCMETRIIARDTGLLTSKIKQIRFWDMSKLTNNDLTPPSHSVVINTNGVTTLTEYDSHAEYKRHRNQVFSAVAKFHADHGKQRGCMCKVCGGRRA